MNNNKDFENIIDGFSSQQQLKHQEIIYGDLNKQYTQNHHKQEIKFKLPPRPEIKDKSYALYPDTVTGWSPKIQLPSPIPIIFDNDRYDTFLKIFVKNTLTNKIKLCYLGPRYQNTYYSWYDKQFTFPYSHVKAPSNIKFTNRPFCGQHWDQQQGLIFDSFFQGGNLDSAFKINDRQYQLFLRVDSNTKGHLQWFNFKIKNLQKLLKYKIHICNFQKNKSLYSRGMKPYIFSTRKFKQQKIGWQQSGQHIRYQRKSPKCSQAINYQLNKLYRLSFQFYTEYDNDQLQISYCIPYNYSQLCNFLHKLVQKNQKKGIIKMNKLCTSLGGLQIPLLIIHQKQNHNQSKQTDSTTNSSKNSPQKINNNITKISKKCIIVSGRAHPGQSNGSFLMQGFIQFICGDTKIAQYLRKHIIFKIIPMLNVDGVALGNYRTGLSGRDFNRQFRNPDKIIFPQVYAIKKLVSQNKIIFKQNLLMFLDFHGHSIKKNVFMYGPQFPIIQKYYYQTRIFPKLLGNRTKMFRYYSCIFKVSQFKQTTARAVLLRKIGIPFTYTIQASNGSYYDHQKLKDVPFNDQLWKQMGQHVGYTLYQYVGLILSAQQSRIQKNKQRQKQKLKDNTILFRKNFRSSKNRSAGSSCIIQKDKDMLILPGIQDQKIRLLFQQIKNAQQKKIQQKKSDDQLSQGSSDQEGQADDLSPNKVKFLYQIIKNKKLKGIQKYKLTDTDKDQPRFVTNDDGQQNKQQQGYLQDNLQDNLQSVQKISQEIFQKRSKENQRRSFLCKNKNNKINYIIPQRKKQKATARVINFSFGLSPPVRGKSTQQRSIIPNRINILQFSSACQINQQKKHSMHATRVLDLSDTFRKTYTYNIKQKQKNQQQIKIQTYYPQNIRSKRFDDYKLKKMGLKNCQF